MGAGKGGPLQLTGVRAYHPRKTVEIVYGNPEMCIFGRKMDSSSLPSILNTLTRGYVAYSNSGMGVDIIFKF